MEGRREVHLRGPGPGEASRETDHARCPGDGPEEPARASAHDQAKGLQRKRASARRSAASSPEDSRLIHRWTFKDCMAETKTPEFAGTGRRKTAVARVRLATGSGKVVVNGRPFENYFLTETLRGVVLQPLNVTETTARFDIQVNVKGGGPA